MLQDDSEYPDWLWTLNVKRPLPPLEEQDPNTKQYWMQVSIPAMEQSPINMKYFTGSARYETA